MADTTWILGVVGVVGTIAGTATGALIAARASSAVEERREQRAAIAEKAADRAAARLVWLEFAQVDANLAWAGERRRWSAAKVRLPMEEWDRHRDRLSIAIADPASWHALAVAMAGLTQLRGLVDKTLDGPEERPIDSGIVESFEATRKLVLIAAEVVRPLADLPQER